VAAGALALTFARVEASRRIGKPPAEQDSSAKRAAPSNALRPRGKMGRHHCPRVQPVQRIYDKTILNFWLLFRRGCDSVPELPRFSHSPRRFFHSPRRCHGFGDYHSRYPAAICDLSGFSHPPLTPAIRGQSKKRPSALYSGCRLGRYQVPKRSLYCCGEVARRPLHFGQTLSMETRDG
jgi:hypothetical protein